MKIYTDATNHVDITVSKGNKWYSYLLPKDKGLCRIESGAYDSNSQTWSNSIVTKAVIKADISFHGDLNYPYKNIIPPSTLEVFFKGSNTSNVTDMSFMFCYCSGLTSLDVSNFDTSNVTSMTSMFNTCTSIKSLDLSNFNTSNVTNMNWMFDYCSGFTTLNVSSFDTSNVTSMYQMFEGCTNLNLLDLSGWDMSNVANTTEMFNNCKALKTIRMVGCSEDTVNKITAVKPSSATIVTE